MRVRFRGVENGRLRGTDPSATVGMTSDVAIVVIVAELPVYGRSMLRPYGVLSD